MLSNESTFGLYEGKEKIMELTKTFCLKGIQEKHLYDNIQSLMKEGVIHNLTSEE